MAEKTLLVLGAGGHGKAVAEAALMSGDWQKIVFLDDRWPQVQECLGWPVVGNIERLSCLPVHVDGAIAAVGNNAVRACWVDAIRMAHLKLATVIHPRAFVSPHARLCAGSAVMAMAMVGVDAVIGIAAIINASATVDHDAVVGDFAHLGVGVHIAGGVNIGARAWLQAGCCVGYQVVVVEGAVYPPGSALHV